MKEYAITLKEGASRVPVIKKIREITGWCLWEAKTITERPTIKMGWNKLEDHGACRGVTISNPIIFGQIIEALKEAYYVYFVGDDQQDDPIAEAAFKTFLRKSLRRIMTRAFDEEYFDEAAKAVEWAKKL